MLILTGIFSFGWISFASGDSYKVTAVVPAEALTVPAIILSPQNDEVLQTSKITVTGSCPDNSYVKLFQNNIFAGASLCQSNGQWLIELNLTPGKNSLRAQDYNITDQPGPASPEITVTHNPPSQPTGSSESPIASPATASPLILSSDFRYYGVLAGQSFQQSVTINGGTGPYALSVDWGDGTSDLFSQMEPGSITMDHVYAYPGDYKNSYIIKITATDMKRQTASLQTVAIIAPASGTGGGVTSGNQNQGAGQSGSTQGVSGSGSYKQFLAMVVPTYAISLIALGSFWLGEHRQLEILRQQVSHRGRRVAH